MARRWIAVSLLVFLMTVCLTGCGMGIGHGIIKEFTENKDSILEELTELKDSLVEELEAAYSLTVTSGTAVLYWLNGEEEKVIADASGEDVYSFRIHAGGNFLVLKGDNFTGSLTLTVN